MHPKTLTDELASVAPGISNNLQTQLLELSQLINAPHGHRVFGPGDGCENFLIALAGAVRVEHMGATGRSVVLYRVSPGDTCVMTTSCLLAKIPYDAYGYAEGELRALALRRSDFFHLLAENAEFRSLAFATFAGRIVDIVHVVDELLSHRVDLKIAGWLADQKTNSIQATHQQIAAELGTAREVVSRTLKEFERNQWVRLARGEIEVCNRSALTRHAAI